MKTYFNVSDGGLIKTWVSCLTIFFILSLTNSIFGPVMNRIFSPLVDQYAFQNASLLSAKHLVLLFFNNFFFVMAIFILIFAVLSSLRREDDTYRH